MKVKKSVIKDMIANSPHLEDVVSNYHENPKIGQKMLTDSCAPDEKGHTHIYGVGLDIKTHKMSDPDRMVKSAEKRGLEKNYLEYIYKRFEIKANENGCRVYNFSDDPLSRLPYTKVDVAEID